MWWRSCGLRVARSVLPAFVVVTGARVRAQPTPSFELPLASLESIASDFESGRNQIYCYHGGVIDPVKVLIQVDSVSVVTTPEACDGIGIGYISRIDDRAFLIPALRGLMESNVRFRVASAFYAINTVEVNGRSVRAARSLSVLRGNANAVEAGRTRLESDGAGGLTRGGNDEERK
jgi:hypothetical protein